MLNEDHHVLQEIMLGLQQCVADLEPKDIYRKTRASASKAAQEQRMIVDLMAQ